MKNHNQVLSELNEKIPYHVYMKWLKINEMTGI
jgi:hypothetical protein